MSLRQRTIGGLKWSFIDGFANQGLQFMVGIVLARLLTPGEFGLIGMLTFFIAISQVLMDSGFSQALIRKPKCSQEDLNITFYFNLIVGLAFYLILFAGAGLISSFFAEPQLFLLIRVLGLVLIINGFGLIQRTILTKEIDFRLQAKVSIIASLLSGIIGIGMALGGCGVWSLVGKTLALQLCITALFWLWNPWRPTLNLSTKSFKELFGFGSKLLASGLIETVYSHIYYLIIGKYFLAAELGYYTRADEFQRLPSANLNSIIGRVSYPALVTIQGDTEKLKATYKMIIRTTMYVTFLLMIGLAATARQVILLLIGEKWLPAVPYLQLLCFSGMLYPLHALNLNMLKIKARSDLFLKLEIIKKVLAIPTIVVGIFFGIHWMLVGMIVNSVIAYFLNSAWSGSLIGYPMCEQIADIAPSFLMAIVMGTFVYGIGMLWHASDLSVLLLQISVGAGIVLILSQCTSFEPYRQIRRILAENIKMNIDNITSKPVYVTQPSLPPLEEFILVLEKIWQSKWLTNNGAFHQQFEAALAEFLGVKYVSLFCNGMMALQTGLQALRITGEVITTPFSFVATTHAIHWNGCTPVFCDIEPDTFTLDPEKVESLITPKTTALLPVHVYGNPCKLERLQQIADTYGLKLFYDAAHAFGVKNNGQSILNFGDLSMLSFHATKVFNTFEGGALITDDPKLKQRIDFLKNFGFADEVTVVAPGTNGKMNEFQAALGLLQLRYYEQHLERRRNIFRRYREALKNCPGIRVCDEIAGVQHNYSYFPIFVDDSYPLARDEAYDLLKQRQIHVRRYFYPLISQFPTYRHLRSAEQGALPIAEQVSQEVICLPIYSDLNVETVDFIAELISGKDR